MITIICLHINLCGNKINNIKFSNKYKTLWALETICYCGVNCFGLISGAVGYKKYNFSNLIYIYIQIWFYSITISSFLFVYDMKKFPKRQLQISFFPLLIKRHWYFNAYFMMYLFLPFIIKGINNLEKKVLRNIIIFFILFFPTHETILKLTKIPDHLFLMGGYSSLWLSILFIIGGYFGKYIIINEKIVSKNFFIFWGVLYLISFYITHKIHLILLKNNKTRMYKKLLISYISPTILFQSISLLMVFSKLKIKSYLLKKIISFFSPLVFSVLLIHSRIFKSKLPVIEKLFKWINSFNDISIFFVTISSSIFIFIICSFFDYFRLMLFKFLKIKEICSFINNKFPNYLDKLI